MNENQLLEDIYSFFNESDTSIGWYPVDKIDEEVIEELRTEYEGIIIISYGTDEVIFDIDSVVYKAALRYHDEDSEWKVGRYTSSCFLDR